MIMSKIFRAIFLQNILLQRKNSAEMKRVGRRFHNGLNSTRHKSWQNKKDQGVLTQDTFDTDTPLFHDKEKKHNNWLLYAY